MSNFDKPVGKVIPGRTVSAQRMQRISDQARRGADVHGGGTLGLHTDVGGPTVYNGAPEEFWIRISSGSNPYTWDEVFDESLGTTGTSSTNVLPELVFASREIGDIADFPAYEASGFTAVPAGAIARAYVDPASHRVWFKYGTGATTVVTNLTTTGGTVTITTETVTSTGSTWTITGDTWTFDVTTNIYLPSGSGSGGTYIGTVPVKPCTLNWCPVLLYTTEGISPAYTRTDNVLTAVSNGVMPNIDGVTPVVGNRILIDDNSAAANTGIYTVTSVGSGGTPYVLTRAVDANVSAHFWGGRMVVVTKGTTYADTLWELETPDDGDALTLNTTGLSFKQLTGGAAAAHNLLSATHTDTLAGTVVRGDMIRGNSTPKWERRAITTTAGYVWTSDGTDCDWQQALKPIAITLGGTIAGGTTWYKTTVSVPAGDLNVGSASLAKALFTLPAGAIPKTFKLKTSTAFAGPATVVVNTLSTTLPTQTLWSGTFDLKTAVAKTVGMYVGIGTFQNTIPSHSDATTVVGLTFSASANLSTLTDGVVDVWLEVAVVP